jgi:hypothetical protein
MKNFFLTFAFVLFLLQSFGQLQTKPALTKSDSLLLRNKHQKTVGWVLLGGGLISLFLGGSKAALEPLGPGGSGNGGISGSAMIAVAGFGAMVASIPVFISAGKSKRNAAALSFTNQKLLFLQHKDFAIKMQPAVTLKVSL